MMRARAVATPTQHPTRRLKRECPPCPAPAPAPPHQVNLKREPAGSPAPRSGSGSGSGSSAYHPGDMPHSTYSAGSHYQSTYQNDFAHPGASLRRVRARRASALAAPPCASSLDSNSTTAPRAGRGLTGHKLTPHMTPIGRVARLPADSSRRAPAGARGGRPRRVGSARQRRWRRTCVGPR